MIKTSKFNLPIIQRKRTKGSLILISTILILLVVLVISIIDDNNQPPHYRTMSIAIITLCSGIVYILRSYYVEDFARIGNVMISVDTLEITFKNKTTIYTISEIKQLIVKLNETSEDAIVSRGLNAFMEKEGIDNEIELIDFENNSLKYQVFIKNESWIRLIDRILIE